MSAPRNPNTAALEALIEAHAIELELPRPPPSERSRPKRSASNRPRSRTSARCWRPRWPNAPNVARSAG